MTWQTAMQQAITDPAELLHILELDKNLLEQAQAAAKLFPLKVPRGFVNRMQKGNPLDPLLLQILPLAAELPLTEGYETDPLKESAANPLPGLLHKYHSRVLITLVGACPIHCRYCFRRHFPYERNNPGKLGWEKIFDYLQQDKNISEVILSGGEPLMASDGLLQSFTEQLDVIPHIKRLRIHTRIPIVLPERITESFIAWIAGLKQQAVMVLHCNHPQEINHEVVAALQHLRRVPITLLNQSVLLKDINDDVDILAELSETLFAAGVIPYYLHVADKVQGTAHFDTRDEIARQLHQDLTERLSGYLVPRLVREVPGAPAKVELKELYTA